MEIEIFSDETQINNKKKNINYMGIGSLFVPTEKKDELTKNLSNIRCLNPNNKNWSWDRNNCEFKESWDEKYHKRNDCEIHYTNLKKSADNSKKEIGKKWIELLLNNNRNDKKLIYFNITYIDLNLLDDSYFGEYETNINIYNRFYRSNILLGSQFFGNNVSINKIYHDKSSNKENHSYFPRNLSKELRNKKGINFKENEINFIDSNHNNVDSINKNNSQLIQFIDLILGTVSQVLFQSSEDKMKVNLSNLMYPLVKRIIESPWNKNSSYNYYNCQNISFFPKGKISRSSELISDNLTRNKGQFHKDFKVPKPNMGKDTPNILLDNWIKEN